MAVTDSGAASIAMKPILVLHLCCVFAVFFYCGVGYSGELGNSTAARLYIPSIARDNKLTNNFHSMPISWDHQRISGSPFSPILHPCFLATKVTTVHE